MTIAPVPGYLDMKWPYLLDTNASDVGIGAVLSQVQDGETKAIAYYSKTLTSLGKNYGLTWKEPLARVKTIMYFRPSLYRSHFTLGTYHV